jgi:high affinity Mn2+ porin
VRHHLKFPRLRGAGRWITLLGAIIGVSATAAFGADPGSTAVKAPFDRGYDWSGAYFGGHVGYGTGRFDAALREPEIGAPIQKRDTLGSLYAGAHIGYNFLLPSRILLGAEADVSFPNYLGTDDIVSFTVAPVGHVAEKMDFLGSVRGRLGYAFGHWLWYGTGGLAFTQLRFLHFPPDSTDLGDAEKVLHFKTGWTAGAGVEKVFEGDWRVRLEYLYSRFGTTSVLFPFDVGYASAWDLHTVRIGLNHKLAWPGAATASAGAEGSSSEPDSRQWELHAQTTYIHQGYPAFHALYTGPNSLTPGAQAKETWSNSAFVGVRLWQGGELYYNPELLQGFGLSSTFGAGGFPNGEAQKSDFAYPHYNTSRLFLRQTFGFGGEQEPVESAYGQMAGTRDVSRLTLQAGKFAVHDAFDGNSYASDPRVHFMNWALWAGGAFDYAADKLGLTYGAIAEVNQKDWAFRTGYFLVADKSNSNDFDMALFKRGGYVAELELRYTLLSRAGKLRLLGFVNSAFSGRYREATELAAAIPGLDPTDALVQDRAGRIKYGYAFNVEQSLTDDVGLFGRWSWNDGKNEIMAFTDIDSSLSFGAALKGKAWGRPDDTIGIGSAINALSRDHRDYLAAGGLSILIGDGRLNYRRERILETYYALALMKDVALTFDYQFLQNPAYNADRGPVHIFTGRLHAEL